MAMPRKNRTVDRQGSPATAASPAVRQGERGSAHAGLEAAGEVRIIGGLWRGRKLRFSGGVAGLRPTPDRVRETLFNWLQFELAGARCLDLFAGSGALGMEALSRGAAQVTFVESSLDAVQGIVGALTQLGAADRARVERRDAFDFLRSGPAQPHDVVFLDPPYEERWLGRACEALAAGGWLAPAAWVYLEDAARHGEPVLPAGWTLHRSKRAGGVGYHLARRGPRSDAPQTT
jgi:16S rRNA (guanine966-N2)-methyltransferase